MNRYLKIVAFGLMTVNYTYAQTIQVNPDGTHTIIFDNGSTSTQINPDGTHTIYMNQGNHIVKINPDGTNATIFNYGDNHGNGYGNYINGDENYRLETSPESLRIKK